MRFCPVRDVPNFAVRGRLFFVKLPYALRSTLYALRSTLYETYNPTWGRASHPGYGQKPYVRITLPDGHVFEGGAAAWAADKVLVDWYDPGALPEYVVGIPIHTQYAWADAKHVERVKRREASWQAPRDDYKYFEQQGEL